MKVVRFIGKRLFYAAVTLLVLSAITFALMQVMPGDPFIGNKAMKPEIKQAMMIRYGLDKPVWQQYLIYMGKLLKGDLGESLYYKGRAVTKIIAEAFPYSFALGIRALLFGVIGGIFLGIIAGIKRGTRWDTLTTIIAIIGISVPSFIIGYLIQYGVAIQLTQFIQKTFNTKWRLVPVAGWDSIASQIMPSFALGLGSLATISRMMRTSILDVTGQDYIATAKSKGLTPNQITVRHTIRNAILPVITVLGPMAAAVLTGAFVVENIFSIPGMGKFFVISVQNQDYPMITGTTLFYGAFLVIATMLVDIVYGLIDPRIRLE